MSVNRARYSIISLTAAALVMLSSTSRAQDVPLHGAAQEGGGILQTEQILTEEDGWALFRNEPGMLTMLAGRDLSSMTKKEWKSLEKTHLQALRSADEHVWQEALQSIIHLSRFYGEHIDFRGAATPMLEIYIFDRNERHRILALAGLHAVGHQNAMAHLARRVKLERSPVVRRITLAALADHYGIRDYHGPRENESHERLFVDESPADRPQ